jgi:heterodisulfide reductase subunit B
MTGKFPEFRPIPIMYFTQLMAYALGAPIESLGLESNKVDPRPLFERLSGSIPREVPV